MKSIAKQIKMMLIMREEKQVELAEKMGYTKQGFNKLIAKDDFKLKDIEKISELMEYEIKIVFIDKKTGKEMEIE